MPQRTAQAPAQVGAAHPPLPPHASPARLSTRRKIVFATLTCAAVLIAIALAAEVALRVRHGAPLTLHSTLPNAFQRLGDAHAAYHERLGWVPRPGRWEFGAWAATVDQQGFRGHGPPHPADRPTATRSHAPVILTVGDSFTFGDEVNDHETWPYQLQHATGARVLNAGVFAYGVDQAVLRAEQLLASHNPDWIVLALIADDVRRCEFSYYSAHKPYFELDEHGQLLLRNTPVPTTPPPQRLQKLRKLLGYSYAARSLASRVAPDWWRGVTIRREHDQGPDVTAALLRRLAAAAAQRNARLLVLALSAGDRLGGNASLRDTLRPLQGACDLLDLTAELPAAFASGEAPARDGNGIFKPKGHYTQTANAWVARRVAQRLALTATPAATADVAPLTHTH